MTHALVKAPDVACSEGVAELMKSGAHRDQLLRKWEDTEGIDVPQPDSGDVRVSENQARTTKHSPSVISLMIVATAAPFHEKTGISQKFRSALSTAIPIWTKLRHL